MGADQRITADEVSLAREMADELAETDDTERRGDKKSVAVSERDANRIEALSLRLAGFSFDQIATRLDVSVPTVIHYISGSLEKAENRQVAQMREVENKRLDRAQLSIWESVLKGDLKAIDAFLKISRERSKINGMYAPTKIDMNVGIRHEMESALADLERLMNQRASTIVEADVVEEFETENFDYVRDLPPDIPQIGSGHSD
jgi:transposase